MNREEAKYLLGAYRVGGQDAGDPQFSEALGMLKTDPELARWFAEQQAFDLEMAGKIGAFPVPPELKVRLLAARKIIPLPRWRRKAIWLAAAASIVLAWALIFSLRVSSGPRFAEFRSYVGAMAGNKPHPLDLMSDDLEAVRRWLSSHNAPDDFIVPAGLDGRPSLGCRVFDWRGNKVSFVCFRLGNRHLVHLFVMDRGKLRGIPRANVVQPVVFGNGVATLSWIDDKRVYVLAGHESERELKSLL